MKISLLDFILTGKFGAVTLGQTKGDIQSNFSLPDDVSDMGYGMSIWRYGTLELHFIDETLFMIWSDWLELIQQTDKYSLDLWIFNDLDKLTYPFFRSQLDAMFVEYTIVEKRYSKTILPDNIVLSITNTPVIIYFEDTKKLETNINDYYLIAIGAHTK